MSYSKEVLREASQDYSPRPARVDPKAPPLKVDSNFNPNRPLTKAEVDYANKPFYNPNNPDPVHTSNQNVGRLVLSGGKGSVGRDEINDVLDRSMRLGDPELDQSLRVKKGLETLRSMMNKPK